MFQKLFKIVFFKAKKYFIYIFLGLFLSFFSYILGSNIIQSVETYLTSQVQPLLGGDLVISGDSSIDIESFDNYKNFLEVAESTTISSTIFNAKDEPQLFTFVYHSENYPFYNSFTFAETNPKGNIIVSPEVLYEYGDTLNIFDDDLAVRGILEKGPLSNISLYANNNKIYIPGDLWKTELGEGGRISYKYFFKWLPVTTAAQKENIIQEIKAQYDKQDYSVQTTEDRNNNISQITDRFYSFIHFFNIIIFVLTFFIVFLSLESFYKRITKDIGLLNILGMTKNYIFSVYALFLLLCFFLAFIFAYGGNILVFQYIPAEYDFLTIHFESLIKAIGILFVLFIAGASTIYLKIHKASLQDLLSNETDFSRFTKKDYAVYVGLLYSASFFINLISGISIPLSFLYSFIYIALIGLFYSGIHFLLLALWNIVGKRIKNFYVFDAMRSTIKPGNISFLFVFSSLISVLSIFIFYVFSSSFLSFLNNLTQTSNDMFVLNVQQEDIKIIEPYFSQDEIFEIVNVRLEKINNNSLEVHLNKETLGYDVTREFFSTTNTGSDPLVSGTAVSANGVSVEAMFAKRIKVDLGDTITFSVAGLEKQLTVVNLRKTNRTAGKPFFFFEFHKPDFLKYPKTYFLSYKQSDKVENLALVLKEKTTSNLTFINTQEIITIVTGIADKILLVIYIALSYIAIFSFLGFLVSIQFLTSFKRNKSSLLYILGGNQKSIARALGFEYSYMIFLGSIFAMTIGTLALLIIFSRLELFTLSGQSFFTAFVGTIVAVSLIILSILTFNKLK